jgi:hypothetical protein
MSGAPQYSRGLVPVRGTGRFVHCGTYLGQAFMEQSGPGQPLVSLAEAETV